MHDRQVARDAFHSVARILGFEPHESVALLLGARDGAQAVLRADLPDPGGSLGPGSPFPVLPALGPGIRGALLLYTPLPWADALDICRQGLLAAAARLRADGVPVGLTAVSAGDGWGQVPEAGAPLPHHRGPAPGRRVRGAARLPRQSPERRREFACALRAAQGRSLLVDSCGPRPTADVVEAALAGHRVAALGELVARMASDDGERDRALRCIAWGRTAEAAGGGGAQRPPDPARVSQGIELLRYAAAAATTRHEHAVLLTAIAWLHFALGGGSLAGEYLAHALSWDPGSEFAEAVAEMVDGSPVAPWQLGALSRWAAPATTR